ncbi:MAG: hypothetical protein AAB800_04320 [Patescibacteria group bacterium]
MSEQINDPKDYKFTARLNGNNLRVNEILRALNNEDLSQGDRLSFEGQLRRVQQSNLIIEDKLLNNKNGKEFVH